VRTYARRARPPVSQFVHGIWAVEGCAAGPHRQERYMPSGESRLIIPLRDDFPPVVSRPHSRSFVLTTSAASEVGVSPKVFCRLRRFPCALRQVDGRSSVNWTDLALVCGYYDQAHFTHEFREFAGLTPTEYAQQRVTVNHVALAD
jgi:Helix-turn-helix domain